MFVEGLLGGERGEGLDEVDVPTPVQQQFVVVEPGPQVFLRQRETVGVEPGGAQPGERFAPPERQRLAVGGLGFPRVRRAARPLDQGAETEQIDGRAVGAQHVARGCPQDVPPLRVARIRAQGAQP